MNTKLIEAVEKLKQAQATKSKTQELITGTNKELLAEFLNEVLMSFDNIVSSLIDEHLSGEREGAVEHNDTPTSVLFATEVLANMMYGLQETKGGALLEELNLGGDVIGIDNVNKEEVTFRLRDTTERLVVSSDTSLENETSKVANITFALEGSEPFAKLEVRSNKDEALVAEKHVLGDFEVSIQDVITLLLNLAKQ